jgi:hypothetical protein
MSHSTASKPLPGEPGKPWLTISLLVGFLLGGAGLVLWKPAKGLARDLMAAHHAANAATLIEIETWNEARVALSKAAFWRPDHPALLRVTADFLIKTKGPAHSTLHYLRLLDGSGAASEADLLTMARLYAETQSVVEAEKTLARLPATLREESEALEVLSSLQRQRGDRRLSDQTLRRALGLKIGDRDARLRLAIMNLQEPFEEVRARAKSELWALADGKDAPARKALEQLANDLDMLPLEADRLFELVKTHPEVPEALRLQVLTALLRAKPDRRQDSIDQEVRRMATLPADQLRPCLLWLLQHGLAEQVVTLHPREFFIHSTDLIDPYLQALAALKRWQAIEDLLARPVGMPVSAGYVSFWRAQATLQIDQEPTRARQHLSAVWEASGRGRQAVLGKAGAALADHAGLWDLAISFYHGLAEHQPGERVAMLEKILDAARHAGDAPELIRTAAALQRERPQDRRFEVQHLYLRLICGQDLELAWGEIQGMPPSEFESADDLRLCLALAAYRMGEREVMAGHLREMSGVGSLSAWQRAVYAGLLAHSGQPAEAFQEAEKISAELLLPEEKRFLKTAL